MNTKTSASCHLPTLSWVHVISMTPKNMVAALDYHCQAHNKRRTPLARLRFRVRYWQKAVDAVADAKKQDVHFLSFVIDPLELAQKIDTLHKLCAAEVAQAQAECKSFLEATQ